MVRTKATLGRSVARAAELRTARRLDGFIQGGSRWHLISGGGEGGLEITKLAFPVRFQTSLSHVPLTAGPDSP